MNIILLFILLLLMIYVGGKRGFKIFISLVMNFIVLIITFYLITLGLNTVVVTLLGCLVVSYITLYYVNSENIKTKASMKSIFLTLILLISFVFLYTYITRIAGFSYESYEEINMFSYDIGIDYTDISTSMILIGLIGATIDASIAISTALYEVYLNNKKLSSKELFKSGINIGKDILGTTVNTLLFAFLGEFMTLIIWFNECNYTFATIINSKIFVQEFVKVSFSIIGCLIVIPTTAYIISRDIKKKSNL